MTIETMNLDIALELAEEIQRRKTEQDFGSELATESEILSLAIAVIALRGSVEVKLRHMSQLFVCPRCSYCLASVNDYCNKCGQRIKIVLESK